MKSLQKPCIVQHSNKKQTEWATFTKVQLEEKVFILPTTNSKVLAFVFNVKKKIKAGIRLFSFGSLEIFDIQIHTP